MLQPNYGYTYFAYSNIVITITVRDDNLLSSCLKFDFVDFDNRFLMFIY
jgi:hypothetical protein